MVLLPENGRFEETPFPRLLLDLHRANFTGTVRMRRESAKKSLRIHDGVPVFAESNLSGESLVAKLVKAGRIGADERAQVRKRIERDGCTEERAVLELELVPPRDLFEALKEQVRGRLLECFDWSQGSFQIVPGDPPPEGAQAFRTDLVRLLHEGIETRWNGDRTLSELAPRMGQYPSNALSSGSVSKRLRNDAAVDAVLGAIDGDRTLWQVLELATTPRALAAVWLLDALGAFTWADHPATAPADEESKEPEVEIVFETVETGQRRPRESKRSTRDEVDESRPRVSDAVRDQLLADIAEKYADLGRSDHYTVLGVDSRADAETIKRAYLRAAKDYHPDTLARSGIGGEVRVQAGRIFAAIGKAYNTLSRTELRREYDAQLSGDAVGADAEQIAAAETLYRKGEILLRQGNFRGALEFLLPAVEKYPAEADYQNAAGWALYRKSPPDSERAKVHLERAAALAPQDAEVQYRLGVVLRSLGDAEGAEAAFTRSRAIDPAVG
jgi:tetratricopeptide (TPR) repeat protein